MDTFLLSTPRMAAAGAQGPAGRAGGRGARRLPRAPLRRGVALHSVAWHSTVRPYAMLCCYAMLGRTGTSGWRRPSACRRAWRCVLPGTFLIGRGRPPEHLLAWQVVMGDVACGAHTPSMVKKVQARLKSIAWHGTRRRCVSAPCTRGVDVSPCLQACSARRGARRTRPPPSCGRSAARQIRTQAHALHAASAFLLWQVLVGERRAAGGAARPAGMAWHGVALRSVA